MYVNDTRTPVYPGPPPMIPPPVGYQQGPDPYGPPPPYPPPAYGQPVAPAQPTTVIVKERVENNTGSAVAEGCCAGCLACFTAVLCCCCMAAASSPGHHHHHHRRW